MTRYINNLRTLLLGVATSVIVMLGFTNCQDDYIVDGGLHDPNFNGTMMQYFDSRPDLFKELSKVIRYSGLEDVMSNEEITFFAPTDFSIKATLDYLNKTLYRQGCDSVTDIRQIDPDVWKEYLSLYIIRDKYTLKDVAQIDTVNVSAYPGQAYYSLNGRPMNVGVIYHDANGVKYAGYRQLLYSYIHDFSSMSMTNAYVATCNIQPINGVIHVIRFIDHSFGFSAFKFSQQAIAAGIKPKDDIVQPANQ